MSKKLMSLVLTACIVFGASVTAFASPAKTDYVVKVVGKTISFVKDGKVIGSFTGKNTKLKAVKNKKTGNTVIVFVDSNGRTRNISMGKQENVFVDGKMDALTVEKSITGSVEVPSTASINTLTVRSTAADVSVASGATIVKAEAIKGADVEGVKTVTISANTGSSTGSTGNSGSSSGSFAPDYSSGYESSDNNKNNNNNNNVVVTPPTTPTAPPTVPMTYAESIAFQFASTASNTINITENVTMPNLVLGADKSVKVSKDVVVRLLGSFNVGTHKVVTTADSLGSIVFDANYTVNGTGELGTGLIIDRSASGKTGTTVSTAPNTGNPDATVAANYDWSQYKYMYIKKPAVVSTTINGIKGTVTNTTTTTATVVNGSLVVKTGETITHAADATFETITLTFSEAVTYAASASVTTGYTVAGSGTSVITLTNAETDKKFATNKTNAATINFVAAEIEHKSNGVAADADIPLKLTFTAAA